MQQAYDGKVRKDLDHEQLMPAAWRLEKYLDADGDGDDDLSLDALRAHKLVYNKARPGDDMARADNVDDLVVSQRCSNPVLCRFRPNENADLQGRASARGGWWGCLAVNRPLQGFRHLPAQGNFSNSLSFSERRYLLGRLQISWQFRGC